VNAYMTSVRPCGPGLKIASWPMWVPIDRPAAVRTTTGSVRKYSAAYFISVGRIFLPMYSGVRPTISPPTNTVTMARIKMPYMPAPMPPGAISPSAMSSTVIAPPNGLSESWKQFTAPVDVTVVDAANTEQPGVPNLTSVPSAAWPANIVAVPPVPVEEIKRASDAFGLDSNFMKAVARIESGFDPKQRTGSYIGLFQLSKYEFSKFGSGQILDPRDNAVAAAYKVITEGILFEWVTHRKPTLSDLYLIHQQGWEGAAEHISQPDRIAWRSMCATSEGMEKGEKWCKRAIWRNTLPAVKQAWKSVDKLTSGAFVGMWRERVADFYSKYMAAAAAAAERANP